MYVETSATPAGSGLACGAACDGLADYVDPSGDNQEGNYSYAVTAGNMIKTTQSTR